MYKENTSIGEDIVCNDYEEILYQSKQKEIEKMIGEAQLRVKKQRSRDIQDREDEKFNTIRLRKSWSWNNIAQYRGESYFVGRNKIFLFTVLGLHPFYI